MKRRKVYYTKRAFSDREMRVVSRPSFFRWFGDSRSVSDRTTSTSLVAGASFAPQSGALHPGSWVASRWFRRFRNHPLRLWDAQSTPTRAPMSPARGGRRPGSPGGGARALRARRTAVSVFPIPEGSDHRPRHPDTSARNVEGDELSVESDTDDDTSDDAFEPPTGEGDEYDATGANPDSETDSIAGDDERNFDSDEEDFGVGGGVGDGPGPGLGTAGDPGDPGVAETPPAAAVEPLLLPAPAPACASASGAGGGWGARACWSWHFRNQHSRKRGAPSPCPSRWIPSTRRDARDATKARRRRIGRRPCARRVAPSSASSQSGIASSRGTRMVTGRCSSWTKLESTSMHPAETRAVM